MEVMRDNCNNLDSFISSDTMRKSELFQIYLMHTFNEHALVHVDIKGKVALSPEVTYGSYEYKFLLHKCMISQL